MKGTAGDVAWYEVGMSSELAGGYLGNRALVHVDMSLARAHPRPI